LDVVLQQLDSWSSQEGGITEAEVVETLDLPSLVAKLRQQRMNMVQTLEQYDFLYKAILEDLQQRVERSKCAAAAAAAAAAAGQTSSGSRAGGQCR
jgi:protein tyrosine phosphatase